MFDNVCSLPVRGDVFSQSLHPSLPVFTIGLSSGHVQTFHLPDLEPSFSIDSSSKASSAARSATIKVSWLARRHKGSCRAVAFSLDGETIFSAGTDGLVKAASTETGSVTAKVAIPDAIEPSILSVLSPQALLLGTDSGKVHLFDLRLKHASSPAQTLQPHMPQDDADDYVEGQENEAITSITPLAPSSTSTSGTCRAWITTSGSTLALSDLRKGVVSLSVDQGDALFSSLAVTGGRKERVLAGTASGLLTVWERGRWDDRIASIVLEKGSRKILGNEESIDSLASLPWDKETVAVGLGNGTVKFVKLEGGGKILGSVAHDRNTIEGVSEIDFDVNGRMITAGGPIVKLWHALSEDDEEGDESEDGYGGDSHEDGSEDDGEEGHESDQAQDGIEGEEAEDDEASSSSSSPEEDERPLKKQKKTQPRKSGNHGVWGSYNLD